MKIWNLLLAASLEAKKDPRPNVVLLLADDLGMGDISLNNKMGKIKTPNIDSIGLEGANFLDAHSASTKCSPSRYMLMTGRYSFHDNPNPSTRKLRNGTPHLGDLFKRNGYITGIIGKHQPILDDFKAVDIKRSVFREQMLAFNEWKASLGGGKGERAPGEAKKSFYLPSNYTMPKGPHTRNYDYSFLNQYACCRVGGGYFENGVGTEPFDAFAYQKPYPEGSFQKGGPECQPYKSFNGEDRCGDKPFANGYLAPPYTTERIDGPILVPNFPPSILVQSSYDSREIEQRLATKALDFIRRSAQADEPFFLYYGFRAGHNPFNSPRRFRGTSDAGEIGEAVLELDSIVGRVIKVLKDRRIYDNTVVLFLSDNGAISRFTAETAVNEYPNGSYMWDVYRHYQNAIDYKGVNYKMNGGKQSAYEGGHRLPMLWRFPKLIPQPRLIDDVTVSYIDIYRTLAEIIGDTDLRCGEAPDSRSLVKVLNGTGTVKGPIVHHSVFQGARSIRMENWKLIPEFKELYDLDTDLEELNNLYDNHPVKVELMEKKMNEIVNNVLEREIRTKEGIDQTVC